MYDAEHYQKYKESIAITNKKYRLKNKEKISLKNKEYRQKNKQYFNEYWQKYYTGNYDKILERNKNYALKNPDKIKKYAITSHKRNPIKRATVYMYAGKCCICGKHGYLYYSASYHSKTNKIINGSYSAIFRHDIYLGSVNNRAIRKFIYCYIPYKTGITNSLKNLFFDELRIHYPHLIQKPKRIVIEKVKK